MVYTYKSSARTISAVTPLASLKSHGPFPRVEERAGESSRVLSETLLPATAYCSLSTVHYTYSSNTYDLASVSCGSSTTLYAWAAGRLASVSSAGNDFFYSYLPHSDLLSQMSNQVFDREAGSRLDIRQLRNEVLRN